MSLLCLVRIAVALVFFCAVKHDAFVIQQQPCRQCSVNNKVSYVVEDPSLETICRGTTTTRLQAFMGGSGGYFDGFNTPRDDSNADGNDDNNQDSDNDDKGDDDDNDSVDYQRYKEALEHNTRRTDVRLFLTQRAIQSFINLLITCRDPHTVRWLEVSQDVS